MFNALLTPRPLLEVTTSVPPAPASYTHTHTQTQCMEKKWGHNPVLYATAKVTWLQKHQIMKSTTNGFDIKAVASLKCPVYGICQERNVDSISESDPNLREEAQIGSLVK